MDFNLVKMRLQLFSMGLQHSHQIAEQGHDSPQPGGQQQDHVLERKPDISHGESSDSTRSS